MNYTHNVFNYSKEDLEDTLDKCKLVVLGALVDEGLLEEGVADSYAANHTIILKKNRIFRSFSKDYEEDKSKNYRLLMVGVGGRSSTSFTGRLMEVLDKAIRENVNTPAEEPMNVSGVSNPLGMSPHTKDNEESSYEV